MSQQQPLSKIAAAPAVPLTSVPLGTMVTLHDVRDPGSRSPLRSLGLIDSCRMRLCKIGDPCIVQVRATRIGLSREVARCVFVVPDAADR
jgi:Fe2+ transport system protein FeoA